MQRKSPLTGRQVRVSLLWILISGVNAVVSYLAVSYYLVGRATADTSYTGNITGEAVIIAWLVFEVALLSIAGYWTVQDLRAKRWAKRQAKAWVGRPPVETVLRRYP